MALSVTAPIDRALNKTREVLFAPFDIAKWFKLGFCAFLATLGDSSGGGGGGGGGGGDGGSWDQASGSQQVDRVGDWFSDNWELVVSIGALVVLVILAIWFVVLWLQGRGRFMFLDGVVHNRGAVVEPWKTYRAEGNSVFWFELCLTLIVGVALVITLAVGWAIIWPDIDTERFGLAAWTALVVAGSLLLLLMITMVVIGVFLTDFVVPAMYARRIGVLEGWGVVRREVLAPHAGSIVLYLLMKILIALVSGALVIGLICLTACIAACFLIIPYIGTVLILPLLVFGRCYSLYFLDQLGGEWALFSKSEGSGEVSA